MSARAFTGDEIDEHNRRALGLQDEDPLPVDKPLAYQPFPVEVLPEAVGNFVREGARAIGCDPSYIALPTLACLARAIGNRRVIKLKPTWTEPAIIWAAIIGKSGCHKSPALSIATKYLGSKQAEAVETHKLAVAKFDQEQSLFERDYSAWKRSKSTEPPPWPPAEPHLERFIVSDITVEALAVRLFNQFDGVLVMRDELAGFLDSIGEYKGGKSGDTAHWLSAWQGAPMTIDRKGGEQKTMHIARGAVNLIGGVQPAVLQRAIGAEHLHDGLCARLLLAMPQPKPVRWSEQTISPRTELALANIFDGLLALEPAGDADGNPAPFPLPLTAEARKLWVEYYNRHRVEIADADDDLAAAFSKLEAYSARFALIFQLVSAASAKAGGDAVDEISIAGGIALSDWFGNEARRVYTLFVETDEQRHIREISDWVAKQGGRATARDLQRKVWRFRNEPDEADMALDDLVKAGLGKWHHVGHDGGRGRQTREFRLNSTIDIDVNSPKPGKNGNCVDVDAGESEN